uniref:Packaging protein 3 n=1 Tax=Rhinolophus ferrumequinum adenovirus TaxID=3140013 RepID=A0AAU6S563_9ADEN
MHPVLRQMKPPAPTEPSMSSGRGLSAAVSALPDPPEEGEGIARVVSGGPDRHPRVQVKRDASEAYVPRQNVLRDHPGTEGEACRDLRFRAGREMRLPSKRVIRDVDFEYDAETGISPARAHLEAASLATAYEQTAKEEANYQKSFNNNVRVLVSREEVTIGLMHLWDFTEAYVTNPSSKTLTAQLFLIAQHCRDDGIFKESLLALAEPESQWLVDLINILQSIIVQERSMRIPEKVAAINYSLISLSKHYARQLFKTAYVPLDKEVKIQTFYMRTTIKILALSDDLGIYRNERIQRVVSSSRRRELSDRELMFNLRRTLATSGADSEQVAAIDAGDDLQWVHPRQPVGLGRAYMLEEEGEQSDEEDMDEY